MKSARLNTIAILTAGLLMIAGGLSFPVHAGQRAYFQRTNRVVVKDSTPAPVVDDTPINPDTSTRMKPNTGFRNERQLPLPVKRRGNRR